MLRMLAACEESGRVRDAFAARGWDAWSADVRPSAAPGNHYQGDVRDVLTDNWDLVVAFPPCTHLAKSGNRWLAAKRADGRLQAAARFFMQMHELPVAPYVVIENPVGVMSPLWRKPDQIVHPWWFGDPFRKMTCLWYAGTAALPLLTATHAKPLALVMAASGDRVNYRQAAPGVDAGAYQHYEDSEGRRNRPAVRSRTFPGTARAMAAQWGKYIEDQPSSW